MLDTDARIGYLDHDALERALVAARADAVWVGWGFVAEDPRFVELCERLDIVFVGPSSEVMRRVGDKIEAKRLAEAAGVPVAPWSGGPVETAEDAVRHAEAIGYPLMIKAAAGRRRPRHPPRRRPVRARAGVRERPRRGGPGVRRRHAADGAPDRRGPPRRGPGDRRRPRRHVGGRAARLLLPAPEPEGHRGVLQPRADRRAGARDHGRRPSARAGRGLLRRGHRSSSSTSRPSAASRSWKSTRGSRWSTP